MSNELGLVIRDSRVVVSSKDVARVFEKEHKHVLRDIQGLGCSEEFGRSNFGPVYKEFPDGSQVQNKTLEYLITRDGFTLLAMGYTGPRAMKFKEAYINTFNAMESELKGSGKLGEFADQIPRTMGEALMLAGRLELERAALSAKIEQDAPKVQFAEAVEAAEGDILIGSLAKILKQNGFDIGQNRLYDWMRNNGYIMKYSTLPTQLAMNQGLLVIQERVINKPDGTNTVKTTTKVTPKGQLHFVKKFFKQKAEEALTEATQPAILLLSQHEEESL